MTKSRGPRGPVDFAFQDIFSKNKVAQKLAYNKHLCLSLAFYVLYGRTISKSVLAVVFPEAPDIYVCLTQSTSHLRCTSHDALFVLSKG